MTGPRSSSTFHRLLVFTATTWAVASWIFLIDNNLFSQRERFQESDFIMTFYVAGHLAASGRAAELYPRADAESFIGSSFDHAAHAILPDLPKQTTGAFMYIPLIAGFFAPFSLLDANSALLLWQVLSVLGLGASAVILSRITKIKATDIFFLSFLFGPVFLTLWAGQLGLGFGLLPLCLGYFLIVRGQPVAAGLVWSLLLLKPQYLFAAAFVALTRALMKQYQTLAALLLGIGTLIIVTIAFFSPAVTLQWLASHRVSEAYFFAGYQVIPSHLLTGLPANLLVLFPIAQRAVAKLPLYAMAVAIWLFGLLFCLRFKKLKLTESTKLSITFLVGLVLSSLTLPHLLYYDLCVLLPAGVLLFSENGPLPASGQFRRISMTGWIAVSGFLPFLLAFANQKIMPLVLEIILLALLVLMLRELHRTIACAAEK